MKRVLNEKMLFLKRSLKGKGVKVNYRDTKVSLIEGIISRGDEHLSSLFEFLFHRRVKLEAWREYFSPQLYEEWFHENDIDMRRYLGGRETGTSLPWAFIDTGIDQSFLEKEFGKADSADKTVDCLERVRADAVSNAVRDRLQVTQHRAQTSNRTMEAKRGPSATTPEDRRGSREEIEVTGHRSQGTSIDEARGKREREGRYRRQETRNKLEEGRGEAVYFPLYKALRCPLYRPH